MIIRLQPSSKRSGDENKGLGREMNDICDGAKQALLHVWMIEESAGARRRHSSLDLTMYAG